MVIIDQDKRADYMDSLHKNITFFSKVYNRLKVSEDMPLFHPEAYAEDMEVLPKMLELLNKELKSLESNTVEGVYVADKYHQQFKSLFAKWLGVEERG